MFRIRVRIDLTLYDPYPQIIFKIDQFHEIDDLLFKISFFANFVRLKLLYQGTYQLRYFMFKLIYLTLLATE